MWSPDTAARLLGHPVAVVLQAAAGRPRVAASLAGEPPRVRLAFVDGDRDVVLGRLACPPARPSRFRPVVATVVELAAAERGGDRLVACRTAPGVASVAAVTASDEPPGAAAVGADGIALVRLPDEAPVLAVDALDPRGEPLGRLARAGIGELRLSGGTVFGRLGSSHGMAAGMGEGRNVSDLAEAAFEAGYEPDLPAWLPDGCVMGTVRIEPDTSYPAAPPAVVVVWEGPAGARVLLRQAPGPLAAPDPGGAGATDAQIGGAVGVLRSRWLPTLVWETPERAFGLQARGLPNGADDALRIARSIAPAAIASG